MCNVTFGYRLEGGRNVSCLESGLWSEDTPKIICRGTEVIYFDLYIFMIQLLKGLTYESFLCVSNNNNNNNKNNNNNNNNNNKGISGFRFVFKIVI